MNAKGNWGKTSLAKLSGNKFLPEAVAMFMTEAKSKSNKKIINIFVFGHVIFKFEKVIIKGNSYH